MPLEREEMLLQELSKALVLLLLLSCTTGREVCLGQACVEAEVADTPAARQRGLMGRPPLAEDEGMLFIFDDTQLRHFWMKDVSFPIEIIFISEDKEVISIEEALPCLHEPCAIYSSGSPAMYVVEVHKDFSEKNNISEGERMTIR